MAAGDIRFSWTEFPHGRLGDDHWLDFKSDAQEEFLKLIKEIDRRFADEPQTRIFRLREVRREHHLLIIADRFRRASAPSRKLSGPELRKAAEFILDRSAHIAATGGGVPARNRLEEKMMMSARVDWHKLMRRAGSPAELRGGWGASKTSRGTSTILRRVSAPGLPPEKRAEIFREFVEERTQQMLYVAEELTVAMKCKLPRNDRILVRDLENLLARAQWPKRQQQRNDSSS
ncbi:MAG: hypothetical protein ACM3ZV_08005 [Bacillota bacterium]